MRHWMRCAVWGGVLAVAGCGPEGESGECSASRPCDRGSLCDLEEATCEPADTSTESTEDPAPASFTSKLVPFFRGEVCVPMNIQAGIEFPVRVRPCLHPCLDVDAPRYAQSWSCVGPECDLSVVMWVEADSAAAGCPADAFGRFPAEQCTYPVESVPSIWVATAGFEPIEAMATLELPFLTNADVSEFVAANRDFAVLTEKIQPYPIEANRLVSDISLSLDDPAPPVDCNEVGSCDCFQLGF